MDTAGKKYLVSQSVDFKGTWPICLCQFWMCIYLWVYLWPISEKSFKFRPLACLSRLPQGMLTPGGTALATGEVRESWERGERGMRLGKRMIKGKGLVGHTPLRCPGLAPGLLCDFYSPSFDKYLLCLQCPGVLDALKQNKQRSLSSYILF